MALGLNLIIDIHSRIPDFVADYTDFGILPRSAIPNLFHGTLQFNLYSLFGSAFPLAIFFGVAYLAGFALVFGYRPRLATLIGYLHLIATQNRNHLIGTSGDVVLRLLFFWALFLPLSNDKRSKKPFLSMATAALFIQIASMYGFAALHKYGTEWHNEASATYYALQIDQLATPFCVWLRQFRALTFLLTPAIWYLELFGPFLLFFPYGLKWTRSFAILSFAMMHFAFFSCMGSGVFPFDCWAGLCAFLPKEFWDRFEIFMRPRKRLQEFWSKIQFKTSGNKNFQLPNWIVNGAAGFFMIYTFLWNLSTLPGLGVQFPLSFEWIAQLLRLDQRWSMFAPNPIKEDGWYVSPGTLEDGQGVDVMHFKDVAATFDRPKLISATYRNFREQKFLLNIWDNENRAYVSFYARYLCRAWNENRTSPTRLKDFELYFMREDISLSGRAAPVKVLLWKQNCV